jgi:hypothetical protein
MSNRLISGGLLGIIVFLAVFFWFLVDGGLIETGGDAFGRFGEVSGAARGEGLSSLDHHLLRWGLNIPLFIFLFAIKADHPALYHVVPALFGAGTSLFVWLIYQKKEISINANINFALLTLSLMIIPGSERAFSQLLATGPSIFYMVAALFFLKKAFARYQEHYLVSFFLLAGICCLFAYGSRLAAIWFVIPIGVYLFLWSIKTKHFSAIISFALPIFIGVLGETVIVYLDTGFIGGRALYVIQATGHAGYLGNSENHSMVAVDTLFQYLLSPSKYERGLGNFAFPIYFAVIASFFRLLFRQSLDSFDRCFSIAVVGLFLLQSYTVVGVFPFIYPEPVTYSRLQFPILFLSLVYLGYLISLSRSVCIFLEKKYSFIISLSVLCGSFIFLANPIASRHNNYGIIVTVLHDKVLREWIDHGGNVGYQGSLNQIGEQLDTASSLADSLNHEVISGYVKAIYRRDYCRVSETLVYRQNNIIFGLCSAWKPNETVLIYYATSLEFVRPAGLEFLGSYNDLVN